MKKKIAVSFCILYLVSASTHGSSWPIFTAPDLAFLMQHSYINTKNCPLGEGRVSANLLINIKQFLCKNFCPGIWNWVSVSEEKCHDLFSSFTLKGYEIFNHYDNGVANFSVIMASYGKSNSEEAAFRFVFTSLPGDSWQCYELNPETHTISCSNDI